MMRFIIVALFVVGLAVLLWARRLERQAGLVAAIPFAIGIALWVIDATVLLGYGLICAFLN